MNREPSQRKKLPLYVKIILGMVLGIVLGLLGVSFHFESFIHNWIGPWGTIFIRLLKLIAVPLVLVSLVIGVVNLRDIRNL